jgi:UDP-N-acetylmuramyl pentapeptide synthase
MYDAAVKEGGACATYFATREDLLAALRENTEALLPKGSTVLIKASHGMKFSEVVDFLK